MELGGRDHIPFVGDIESIVVEVERFVTGARATAEPDSFLGTVLFADIVDSTPIAAEIGDRAWTDLLERFYAEARAVIARHRGSEINTTGDGIIALFDGPGRAIRCGLDLTEDIQSLDLRLRGGVHTGEVRHRRDDLAGRAVHIAARVGAAAGTDEVLATRTVRDLTAGSSLRFDARGRHRLKGVPDEWELYGATRG